MLGNIGATDGAGAKGTFVFAGYFDAVDFLYHGTLLPVEAAYNSPISLSWPDCLNR